MPPDWDAFKEVLFRDYPDAWKAYMSSEVLDEFIKEKSRQTIKSLTQFATFNREFRRIMARLVTEGCSNPEELKKAYTKSINSDLHQKIQIYLKSEKAPILKGEPYSIEQVREAAEYVLEGLDPCFEDIITVHQLESSKRAPSLMPAPVKSETAELLNTINMFGQNFQAALTSMQSFSHPPVPNFPAGLIQQLLARPANFPRQDRPRHGVGGSRCFVCHETTHFLGQCDILAQYIANGKMG